jgi:hypothetical protein
MSTDVIVLLVLRVANTSWPLFTQVHQFFSRCSADFCNYVADAKREHTIMGCRLKNTPMERDIINLCETEFFCH